MCIRVLILRACVRVSGYLPSWSHFKSLITSFFSSSLSSENPITYSAYRVSRVSDVRKYEIMCHMLNRISIYFARDRVVKSCSCPPNCTDVLYLRYTLNWKWCRKQNVAKKLYEIIPFYTVSFHRSLILSRHLKFVPYCTWPAKLSKFLLKFLLILHFF